MSIPVPVERLVEALADYGSGYLLSVSADARVKVVTVDPVAGDDVLVVAGPGRGTLGNVAGNAQVTLAFPPRQTHGFTLLVDGTGAVDGDDVRITAHAAVLHRPAAHSDGPPPPDLSPQSR